MINETGDVKLIDFGAVKEVSPEGCLDQNDGYQLSMNDQCAANVVRGVVRQPA